MPFDSLSRPASNLEKFFIYSHDHKTFSNSAIIATYSTPLLQNRAILYKSLRNLILKNTYFTYNYFKNDKNDKNEKFVLKPIENIIFGDVVHFLNSAEVDDELLKHLSEDYWFYYDSNTPLWKVVILNSSNMAFIANRGLFDGESGIQFHREFLKEFNKYCKDYENLLSDLESDQDNIDSKAFVYPNTDLSQNDLHSYTKKKKKKKVLFNENSFSNFITDIISDDDILFDLLGDFTRLSPVQPSSEALIYHSPSIKHLMSAMLKEVLLPRNLINWMKPTCKDIVLNDTNTPPQSIFKLMNIPDFSFSQIKSKCHFLKISITVWLTVCFHYAFHGVASIKRKYLPSTIAIGSRKFIREKFQKDAKKIKFGVFVSDYSFNSKPIDSILDLIPISQKRTVKLKYEIDHKLIGLQDIGSINCAASIKQLINDKSKKAKNKSISISNLGLRDIKSWKNSEAEKKNDDDIYLRDLVFTQGCALKDELVMISTISTTECGLNIVISMEKEYDNNFELMQTRFYEALFSIIKSETPSVLTFSESINSDVRDSKVESSILKL